MVNQAILSWATDGWLIGTAMLPHAEVYQHQAHRTISTGVVSHTLNFHERFEADEWLLLANESIWAGRGRTHGRCNIWTHDGRLVATYTQDNLVRGFCRPARTTPATTTASCKPHNNPGHAFGVGPSYQGRVAMASSQPAGA